MSFIFPKQTGNDINILDRMAIASAVKLNKDARPKPPPKVVEVVQSDFDPTLDDESESDDDGKSNFFHSISTRDVFVQLFCSE